MQTDPTLPEDAQEIAEKVRSGEYFHEAQNMYDFTIHDPMAERYFYVLITGLAALILIVSVFAAKSLYPLTADVPFIVSTTDIVEDLPRIKSLRTYKGEDSNEALLRYLVQNYVIFREEYNIGTFDRNINAVKLQSSPQVYQEFQQSIDPRNPESPITLYQRHTTRTIDVTSVKLIDDEPPTVDVTFTATVTSRNEIKKTRWQANIAFNYSGIQLDEEAGKMKPVDLLITQYRTKRLQDIK